MRKKDLAGWGLQQHLETEKHDGRALLFGTILILVHLLDVQPTEISAAGLKINIDDVAVLRGAVALLFVYFGYRSLLARHEAHYYYPVFHPYADIRRQLGFTRREKSSKGKSPGEIKAEARSQLKFENALKLPFYLGVIIVIVIALLLALTDIYRFLWYLGANRHRFFE